MHILRPYMNGKYFFHIEIYTFYNIDVPLLHLLTNSLC